MPPLLKILRTLRYLRPIQIYGRVWFKLYKPKLKTTNIPCVHDMSGMWERPAQRSISLLSEVKLRFLNVEREIDLNSCWNQLSADKLWEYNLHYFDDLNAVDFESRVLWHQQFLESWVLQNPIATGIPWEAYPTSLRIVNWIKWSLNGGSLSSKCLHSLALQARWLLHRLEYHLFGNHLFVNAKALVYAGLFFKGKEADQWLLRGLSILKSEIPEQILPDGGQFERSTMYHALALEDMLDLVNITNAFPDMIPLEFISFINNWKSISEKMGCWLMAMCHPDGEISFFNDAAIGIAPSPIELSNYAQRLGMTRLRKNITGISSFVDSGYVTLFDKELSLFLDLAPVGPDYLPAHAHADTLSFELSLFGKRIFVNSGTSKYGSDIERHQQRSTAAHNTVSVNGENSSEVWAGFRVAHRAYPTQYMINKENIGYTISCSHNGFMRLPGKCTHQRDWLVQDMSLVITDTISGTFQEAQSFWHIHPDVTIIAAHEDNGLFKLIIDKEKTVSFRIDGANTCEVLPSKWHPEFGLDRDNKCIVASFTATKVVAYINW